MATGAAAGGGSSASSMRGFSQDGFQILREEREELSCCGAGGLERTGRQWECAWS